MKLRNSEKAIFALRELYEGFGYRRFRMNRFEEYELYVRNKDFLVSDRVITFTDQGGRLLALKPDVTLSIIKNAPEEPGRAEKLYYNEYVYRPGADGGFREILQAGLECVGGLGSYEIGEVALLAARSLAALSEDFVLDISHMGLLRKVLEESGLSQEGQKEAMACLHQKNIHELKALCSRENVDGKGLLTLAEFSGGAAALEALPCREAAELASLVRLLESRGYAGKIRVDFSAANDLKYYSGVVFKGYLPGIPTGVLSGGQYDKLLQKMGKKSRAIGFAVYMDLLEDRADTGDIDTLILMDDRDPAAALAAAEEYEKQGSVLVCREIPENRCWKNLVDLRGGDPL